MEHFLFAEDIPPPDPRCSSSGSGGEAYVSVLDVPLDSRVKPRKLTPRGGQRNLKWKMMEEWGYEAKKGLGADRHGPTGSL